MLPEIKKEKLSKLFTSRFLNVFEYPFKENGHYYTATRRKDDDLVMLKSDEEYKKMNPDAVSVVTILKEDGKEPRILMNYEFRYACGRCVMAPPAGLIDPEDKDSENPLVATAIREVKEETGIEIKKTDKVFVVNPLLFSSPGMIDESNGIVCAVVENTELDALNHDGALGSEAFDGFELLTIDEAKEALKNGRDKDGFFYSVYTWICLMYFVSGMWQ